MKIKPLQWEIISFILINLFLIASYYFMAFIFIFAIFIASLAIKYSVYDTKGFSCIMLFASIFLFIFLALFLIAKYFSIYILFKKIENKGSQKLKNILQNLKKSFSLKLKVLLYAFIFDILFITFISFTSPNSVNKDSFTNSLLEYTLFGPLFLIYSFTFILFKVEHTIKTLKSKKKTNWQQVFKFI